MYFLLEDSTACGLRSTILVTQCDTVVGNTAANCNEQIQKLYIPKNCT